MSDIQVLEVVSLDHTPAKKCSDYDEDCIGVKSPSACWSGDHRCGPADGYCPLMYGM